MRERCHALWSVVRKMLNSILCTSFCLMLFKKFHGLLAQLIRKKPDAERSSEG